MKLETNVCAALMVGNLKSCHDESDNPLCSNGTVQYIVVIDRFPFKVIDQSNNAVIADKSVILHAQLLFFSFPLNFLPLFRLITSSKVLPLVYHLKFIASSIVF